MNTKIEYNESHIYLNNLRACLNAIPANGLSEKMKGIVMVLSSLYDDLIYDSPSKKLSVIKTKRAAQVPANQRDFSISVLSGLPATVSIDRIRKQPTESECNKVFKDVGLDINDKVSYDFDTGEWKSIDDYDSIVKNLLIAARKSILEGKDPSPFRKALMWLHFMKEASSNQDNYKRLSSITKLRKSKFSIHNRGVNFLREDIFSDTEIMLQVEVPESRFSRLFTPPVYHNNDDKVIVDGAFQLLIDKISWSEPKDIFLVLSSAETHGVRRGDKILPEKVKEDVIGPFIFARNAAAHTFDVYLDKYELKSKMQLLLQHPSAYYYALIAQQVLENKDLFALATSTCVAESAAKQVRSETFAIHPLVKLPHLNDLIEQSFDDVDKAKNQMNYGNSTIKVERTFAL